jgi:hypothetical protein
MELSLLHPLVQSLHLAYSYGPWVVFAALACRCVLPRVKGGL